MPLTMGCDHVALVTEDLDRFLAFWTDVLEGDVRVELEEDGLRHALVDLGGGFMLHPFAFPDGNPQGRGSDAMFGRGHLDHVALRVEDEATFQELRHRLVEVGASDGTVTDFGMLRSVWFVDPDGMGCEVAIAADGAPRRFDERGQEAWGPVAARE